MDSKSSRNKDGSNTVIASCYFMVKEGDHRILCSVQSPPLLEFLTQNKLEVGSQVHLKGMLFIRFRLKQRRKLTLNTMCDFKGLRLPECTTDIRRFFCQSAVSKWHPLSTWSFLNHRAVQSWETAKLTPLAKAICWRSSRATWLRWTSSRRICRPSWPNGWKPSETPTVGANKA